MAKLGDLIKICDGRLTLTSGTPVTTSDVTAATTLYFTPYKGNNLSLYNITHDEWVFYEFSELSISLAGKTADTNYDVFVYDNSGTLTLELVAWSDATTRATALATQDGLYCKTGELNKRYLGTIRTTSTIGQCEDSRDTRFLWNYYNRVWKEVQKEESTSSWTYSGSAWRFLNNSSANRVYYVVGVPEEVYHFRMQGRIRTLNNAWAMIGLGINVSNNSTNSARAFQISDGVTNLGISPVAHINMMPSLGYSYVAALERADGSNNADFYGDNNHGVYGMIKC